MFLDWSNQQRNPRCSCAGCFRPTYRSLPGEADIMAHNAQVALFAWNAA